MNVILTRKQLIHSSKCSQLILNLIVGIFEYFEILSNVEDSFVISMSPLLAKKIHYNNKMDIHRLPQ